MADKDIDLQASNIFDVAENFQTQSSGSSGASNNVTAMDEKGYVVCESVIYDISSYTQELKYCGSDFLGDFVDGRTVPVSFLENFGCTFGGKVVTGITISMTAGEKCSVSIEGHNHGQNEHDAGATPQSGGATRAQALALGIADVSDFMPHETGEAFKDWDGFGVPNFGITQGDSTPKSATVTFGFNHVDEIDETGKHLVGKNITPKCDLTMDFGGIPVCFSSDDPETRATAINALMGANTNDMLGAMTDSTDKNDSNSEFDSCALVAHAHTSLATA